MFGAGDVIAGIRAGGRGPAGIGAGMLGVAVSGGAGLLAGTAGHIALRQGRTWDIAGTIVAGRRRIKSRYSKSSRAFDRAGASCRDCDNYKPLQVPMTSSSNNLPNFSCL